MDRLSLPMLIASALMIACSGCASSQSPRSRCADLTREQFCSHVSEYEDTCCGYWAKEWTENTKTLNIFVLFRPFTPAERRSLEEKRARREFYLPAAIQLEKDGDCVVTKCNQDGS